MLDLVLSTLGLPVAKHLAKEWLGEGLPAEIGGELASALTREIGNYREARKAESLLRDTADEILESIAPALKNDSGEVEVEPVLEQVRLTIEAHATTKAILASGMKPDEFKQSLRDARPELKKQLLADELALYEVALGAVSNALCTIAPKMPTFQADAVQESLDRLERLKNDTTKILISTSFVADHMRAEQEAKDKAVDENQARYREALRQHVSKLRLFGVDLDDDTPNELPLSIAYIPLKLNIEDVSGAIDYPAMLDFLPLFGNRLLIDGVAGSGKTTLLQWTVFQALSGNHQLVSKYFVRSLQRIGGNKKLDLDQLDNADVDISRLVWRFGLLMGRSARRQLPDLRHKLISTTPWCERAPFLVRLRQCKGGVLPAPEDLPALIASEAGDIGTDWVRKTIEGGHALILLDGIDEVPEAKRDDIRDSIARYMEMYSSTFFIVTSRPAAVLDPRWQSLFGEAHATVEPMTSEDVDAFIEHWFRALAHAKREPFSHEAVRSLQNKIGASSSLRRIATTPLLCASIAYLNRVRQGELPSRVSTLYGSLCDLLIDRLDRDRLKKQGLDELAEALVGLDLEDKRFLLASLASSMIVEGETRMPANDAARAIKQALRKLTKLQDRDPHKVLEAFQHRSGVLRGAADDVVEFAHNSFRAFLAGQVAEDQGHKKILVERALSNDDPDLPVFAAAQNSQAFRESIIKALRGFEPAYKTVRRKLDMIKAMRTSGGSYKTVKRKRDIIAIRCCATGPVEEDVRSAMMRLLEQILPPRDLDEASQLAYTVDRFQRTDLLYYRKKMAEETAEASVRLLSLVDGDVRREPLNSYRDVVANAVVFELMRAIPEFEIAAVRKGVLEGPLIPNAQVISDRHAADIAALPSPEALYLSFTNISDEGLEHLKILADLQTLDLSFTKITDRGLMHLNGLTNLQTLDVSDTEISDRGLKHLKCIPNLRKIALIGTEITDQGVALLETFTCLVEASVGGSQVSEDAERRLAATLERRHSSNPPAP